MSNNKDIIGQLDYASQLYRREDSDQQNRAIIEALVGIGYALVAINETLMKQATDE